MINESVKALLQEAREHDDKFTDTDLHITTHTKRLGLLMSKWKDQDLQPTIENYRSLLAICDQLFEAVTNCGEDVQAVCELGKESCDLQIRILKSLKDEDLKDA